MLSATPSECFGVHSSWVSCSLAFATALTKELITFSPPYFKMMAALPRKTRHCTAISTAWNSGPLPQTQLATDSDLQSAQLSNVSMSESSFLFVKWQSTCTIVASRALCQRCSVGIWSRSEVGQGSPSRPSTHDCNEKTPQNCVLSRHAQKSQLPPCEKRPRLGTLRQTCRTSGPGSHHCLSCTPRFCALSAKGRPMHQLRP